MRWAVQYAHSLPLKYTERTAVRRDFYHRRRHHAHAVPLMLLRRLQNVMRASGGDGGVRSRQPLITPAHTLRSPILIIIMTKLQLACRAAGTLLLMRLCFVRLELCAAVEKITAPHHLSQWESILKLSE